MKRETAVSYTHLDVYKRQGILCYNHELTASLRERLCQGILIQLAFGAACVAVAMAINKAKRQEE